MNSDNQFRKTITFTSAAALSRLSALAKKHKLTQGEVIEVLMSEIHDVDVMAQRMDERRAEKVAGRTSIRSMIERQRKQKGESK